MRSLHLVSVAALLASLFACGAPTKIDRKDYPKELSAVFCTRIKECARGDFESAYFGTADCERTWERQFEEFAKFAEDGDCDYDAKAAADLWVLVNEMSCEKFYEGEYEEESNDVWGDCFGG